MRAFSYWFAGLAIAFLITCETPFSFSVYDAKVPRHLRGLTQENLERIDTLSALKTDAFKVALVADVHFQYDNLSSMLSHIDRDTTVAFVIIVGDLTDKGLLQEFIFLCNRVADHLHKPWLTLIGNHDYLSNGATIYRQMFGAVNYSFVFRNVKFILFDDVFWESNRIPEFDWLAEELNGIENYGHVIPIAHIPPQDAQFPEDSKRLYHQLMVQHGVGISLHAHIHRFSIREEDSVRYITVPSVELRSYMLLEISDDEIRVGQVIY